MIDVTQVEEKAERIRASTIEVGVTIGNLTIATPKDLEDMSLRLERAGVALPPFLRGQAGTIYFLSLKALEWRMPIGAVLENCYVTSRNGIERISYNSALIHAIIERNAPLKGRLRYEIIGEGDERRCKVWGTFKGEDEPHVYVSEVLGKLREARGRNEAGILKGSPLWDHQPEVQLFYSASRQWARLFCPDVILGAYTPEDPQYAAVDVTPTATVSPLVQRLRDANKAHGDRGFDMGHIERETGRATIIEGEANPGPQETENERAKGSSGVADHERRDDQAAGGADGNLDPVGRDATGAADQAAGQPSVGEEGAPQEGSGKADSKPKAQGRRK